MKKPSNRKKVVAESADMRREYRFDYRKARPNRFAPPVANGSIAVVLDADVASVFQSSESVNALLRSVILALPKRMKVRSSVASTVEKMGPATAISRRNGRAATVLPLPRRIVAAPTINPTLHAAHPGSAELVACLPPSLPAASSRAAGGSSATTDSIGSRRP